MVRAAKELARTSVPFGHQLGAFVRAPVVEHFDRAVLAAHHDHVLVTHPCGVKVSRLGHLALVADIDPGAAIDTFHLEIEYGGVGVDPLVHTIGPDKAGQLFVRHHHKSLS